MSITVVGQTRLVRSLACLLAHTFIIPFMEME